MIFKSILFSFISLLLIGYGNNISNNTFPNNINNDIPLRLDKYLYIDLSLNNKFKEESSNPLFIYKDNSEHILNLIHIKDYLYQIEETISIDFFKNENNTFYLSCYDGNYVTEVITATALQENENYICLDEYIDNQDTSIKGYGHYGDRLANPGATYKTQRIWLSDNHSSTLEEKGYWKEKVIPYVIYEYQYMTSVIPLASIVSTYDDVTYYYADIPYQITSLSFVIGSNEDIHPIFYKEYEISSLSYGVIYSLNLLSDDSVGVKTTVCNGANATMLGLVVEAYLTYGNSSSNGAIQSTLVNVFNTWFDKKSASKEDLKNTKINDYTGYAKNGNSYEGLEKNGSFSINEKWNTMCSQAGIDPNTGKVRSMNWFSVNGTTIKIILLIGAGALVSAGGLVVYTLLKKKKEKTNN